MTFKTEIKKLLAERKKKDGARIEKGWLAIQMKVSRQAFLHKITGARMYKPFTEPEKTRIRKLIKGKYSNKKQVASLLSR